MGGQKAIAFFYKNLKKLLPIILVGTKNNEVSEEELKPLPLLSNSFLRYMDISLFFKLKKIIKENEITHLIIEHPYFGWLGLLLQKTSKVSLIVRSHNIESLRFKSTGKWWWGILWNYEKWVHSNATINFFITENDLQYAVKNYKVKPESAHVITYGFEFNHPPSLEDKTITKKILAAEFGFNVSDKIIFFNGTLSYQPNIDALKDIIENINPLLQQQSDFNYKIIMCGKGLPSTFNKLANGEFENIIYAGFVPDIDLYFKAADIFINPIIDGGGIKTKLVEALGYNLSSISYATGATGLPADVCKGKLILVEDKDSTSFAKAIIDAPINNNIDNTFYDYFSWGKIADKAVAIIKNKTK